MAAKKKPVSVTTTAPAAEMTELSVRDRFASLLEGASHIDVIEVWEELVYLAAVRTENYAAAVEAGACRDLANEGLAFVNAAASLCPSWRCDFPEARDNASVIRDVRDELTVACVLRSGSALESGASS